MPESSGKELWLEWLRRRAQNTEHDPIWRLTAYWLVIIAFFSLPFVVWIGDLMAAWKGEEFTYLWGYHKILAALLAAMLGLNSVDKYTVAKRNGTGEAKQQAP